MLSMDDVQDLLKKEESGEAHHTMDENECPVMHRVPSVREGSYLFLTCEIHEVIFLFLRVG